MGSAQEEAQASTVLLRRAELRMRRAALQQRDATWKNYCLPDGREALGKLAIDRKWAELRKECEAGGFRV